MSDESILNLEALQASFFESMRVRGYSEGTRTLNKDGLKKFNRYLSESGLLDIKSITSEDIKNYKKWLIDKNTFAESTVLRYLVSLRSFFSYLETVDEIFLNPCDGVELPKHSYALPKKILTPQEVKDILSAPDTKKRKGLRDRAILEVFYSSGIRLAEMTDLSLFDVDCAQGLLRVNKGKGGKGRVVPLGKSACQWVQTYLKDARSHWSKINRDDNDMWLNATRPHRVLKRLNLMDTVSGYGKAALGERVSPHIWRHTCATHMLRGGADVVYVQRLLGHESLANTQIYTRVAVSDVQEAHRKKHPRSRGRKKQAPAKQTTFNRMMPKRAAKGKAPS